MLCRASVLCFQLRRVVWRVFLTLAAVLLSSSFLPPPFNVLTSEFDCAKQCRPTKTRRVPPSSSLAAFMLAVLGGSTRRKIPQDVSHTSLLGRRKVRPKKNEQKSGMRTMFSRRPSGIQATTRRQCWSSIRKLRRFSTSSCRRWRSVSWLMEDEPLQSSQNGWQRPKLAKTAKGTKLDGAK
jgi:hypothetical protein